MPANWIEEIAEAAARRFPRWAPETWRALVDGPAKELVVALHLEECDGEHQESILEAYLKLAAEAVGLGYLYPVDDVGRPNFFSFAWFEVLPAHLASLQPQRQAEVLSACWNVGENLETRSPWFQRLFLELLSERGTRLETFEEDVRRITEAIMESPSEELDEDDFEVCWIWLGEEDARFLPGALDFIAPRVAVVYHRHNGLDGRPKGAKMVWLGQEPKVLGDAGAELYEESAADGQEERGTATAGAWDWQKARSEPGMSAVYVSAQNPWRAICTLRTSQFLVAAYPKVGQGSE